MFQPYRSTPQIIKTKKLDEPKQRQKRKDAKKDIKIPLSIEQKKLLRMVSFTHKKPATPFVADVIIDGLDRSYIEYCIEDEKYHSKSKENVHCKLPQPQFDQLHSLAIEWNVSVRRACHRILFYMLQKEKGE